MNPKVGVVGLWHLGCVLSAAWSSKGKKVIGFDYDPQLIQKLSNGDAPIFEPHLNETLRKNIKKGMLTFSSNISDLKTCDFVFLSYDTPVLDDDSSDLIPLERAVGDLGKILKKGAMVIVSSQTPAGKCLEFRKQLRENNPTLDLVYSPENLRLGEAIQNYLNPGRIVIGSENPRAAKKLLSLFKCIPAKVLTMNLTSAEMVKHGINAFLAASITFANELSDLCETVGADILDVISGIKSDPRIGERAYLSAGIGFSGGTLGRDLRVLETIRPSQNGRANFFKEIHEHNALRKESILERLEKRIPGGSLKNIKVGVLGLTYKPGTSTLRRSLPVEIVKRLIEKGAQVKGYDPKANYGEWPGERNIEIAESPESLLQASQVILVLTEWPEFKKIPWRKLIRKENPQIVMDAKNCLMELKLDQIGYRYFRIGKN